jgi:hypothetical protein
MTTGAYETGPWCRMTFPRFDNERFDQDVGSGVRSSGKVQKSDGEERARVRSSGS